MLHLYRGFKPPLGEGLTMREAFLWRGLHQQCLWQLELVPGPDRQQLGTALYCPPQ